MNILSFLYEPVLYRDTLFHSAYKYNAFYYVIDGRKIKKYKPLSAIDIFYVEEDNIFDNHIGIYLDKCECGEFSCASLQAAVFNEKDTVIWKVHEINESRIIHEYEFDLIQYEKAINEIRECALKYYSGDGIYYYTDGTIWPGPHFSKKEFKDKFEWKQKFGDPKKQIIFYEDRKTRNKFCYKDGNVVPYINNQRS